MGSMLMALLCTAYSRAGSRYCLGASCCQSFFSYSVFLNYGYKCCWNENEGSRTSTEGSHCGSKQSSFESSMKQMRTASVQEYDRTQAPQTLSYMSVISFPDSKLLSNSSFLYGSELSLKMLMEKTEMLKPKMKNYIGFSTKYSGKICFGWLHFICSTIWSKRHL